MKTIGVPLPNTSAKIVDQETGLTDLPPGMVGELVIQGPQIMSGYLNRKEETKQMLRNGWLYTGDLAAIDEDGYFTVVGRKKEMILASGYNVYQAEIDQVLMSHPAVRECCTIGVPDPRRGETVKSFLVLDPGRQGGRHPGHTHPVLGGSTARLRRPHHREHPVD